MTTEIIQLSHCRNKIHFKRITCKNAGLHAKLNLITQLKIDSIRADQVSSKPFFYLKASSPKNEKIDILMLKFFKNSMITFLLLNTKEDILKNVDNQIVDGSL